MAVDTYVLPEFRKLILKPYTAQGLHCDKCGATLANRPQWWQTIVIILSRKSSAFTTFEKRYCSGGKAPSEDLVLPQGTVRSMWTCAGQPQEHLHITCCHCGFSWLMEVKS